MDDVAVMHVILSDPVATRYWSTPPHAELADSEAWVRSMVEVDPTISDDFIVELDGRVIGKLGCWHLPEIGFLLAPDVWGQGLASEAMAAFLAHRREQPLHRTLKADVDPRNIASLRLLLKHGFVETGRAARTWHVGGQWCDSVYLELRL